MEGRAFGHVVCPSAFMIKPVELLVISAVSFGAATLQTGRGFRDIFTDANRNCPPGVEDFCQPDVISPKKALYNLFAQVKFIF